MSAIYLPADVLWERVLKRVTFNPDTACWTWQGAVTSRGYGCIGSGRKGKSITTHRLAVIARDGGIPDGMTVDHLCHNASDCREQGPACLHRRCVNPDHLDVCSASTNNKRARRRWAFCARGHDIKVSVDEQAGTRSRLCECGVIDVAPLPGWWYRNTA